MDKVSISNLQGENGLVNVVRYFQKDGIEYIIYSLNEVDESGFTRLYVAKLNGVDGTYNADTLNDNEWNEVKNLVKLIVKANKEGLPVPVQDLNSKKIKNITLKDKKIFKLNAPLVEDLAKNKPAFNDETEDGGQQKEITQNIDVPNAPTFDTPVQPTFDMPSAPAFDTPVQPTFDVPSAPTFDTPVQPTFDMPSAPTFDAPVQPTFDMPSAPSFDAPVQPTFDMPSAPTFDAPVQPTFDMPSAPSFDAPVQPTFDMPSAPTFDAPVQPTFDMPSTPSFDAPVQPTNNFNFGMDTSVFSTNTNADGNYQEQLEQEQQKNKMLEDQINKLNEEIENYKNIISSIKNMLEK